MKIKVENFRGVKSASVEPAKINIIAGVNHQGKSSFLQAISAAFTGGVIPFDIPKKHASLLVHSGTAQGRVEIVEGDNSITVDYPQAVRLSEGSTSEISRTAAGLESLIDIKQTDRSEYINCKFDSYPDKTDLIDALPKVTNEKLEAVWGTIGLYGWDTAYNNEKSEGAKLKGAWEQITGTKYGANKASGWYPTGWNASIESKSEEKLVEEVNLYQEFYNNSIKNTAIDDAEKEKLEKQTLEIPKIDEKLKDAKEKCFELIEERERHVNLKNSLTNPESIKSAPCPYCNCNVKIVGGKLEKSITDAQYSEVVDKWEQAKAGIIQVDQVLDAAKEQISILERHLFVANEARKKLVIYNTSTVKGDSAGAVEECKKHLDTAKENLDMYRAKKLADKKHAEIIAQVDIVNALSPDGLRKAKLKKTIDVINKNLVELSARSGWSNVSIDEDLSILMHGTPYQLLSQSEQYRCRVVLQILFSNAGDSIQIFDGADILDNASRAGLLKLCMATNGTSFIGMTYGKQEVIDKVSKTMSKIGGKVFWVENGILEEVAQ